MPAERLHKVLAAAGIASRRGSEALIAAGRVTVDGRTARVGESVDPEASSIAVDGFPVPGSVTHVYLVVHKPAGVTSTVRDRHARRTIVDLVPRALLPEGGRIYPVGRLDLDSEGLLLLTNDGAWAEQVLHPSHGVDREYLIGLPHPLTNDQAWSLHDGIRVDEGLARLEGLRPATRAEIGRIAGFVDPPPEAGLTWYRAVLHTGFKRQLRRMFAAVGAPVARLVRVRIGSLRLDLPAGRVRPLKRPEVARLGAPRPDARA
jgi:23S rRNA pseudouridine2605 synthase